MRLPSCESSFVELAVSGDSPEGESLPYQHGYAVGEEGSGCGWAWGEEGSMLGAKCV